MKKNFVIKLFTAISSLSFFSPVLNSVNAVLPIELDYKVFNSDEKRQNGYMCSLDRFCHLCEIKGETYEEKLRELEKLLKKQLGEDFIYFGVGYAKSGPILQFHQMDRCREFVVYNFVSAHVCDPNFPSYDYHKYSRGFVIVSLTQEEYEAIKTDLKFGTEKVEEMLKDNRVKANVDEKK